ncbi:MAG: protease [Isosphaeraceae bacterium]|jgi:Zn-dependent protease/predicted transcriptional regulator|nr:MAG: protease [Isosphaeraceae bacterium]
MSSLAPPPVQRPQPAPAQQGFSFSLRLGSVFGIPIYVHWTFWILILWIALSGLLSGEPSSVVIGQIGFVLALFGCVVLHELGHALAALRYGVKTSDITLLPIGGVARLRKIPERPWEEFVVALAGPAVNVLIAAILYLIGARINVDVSDERLLLKGGFLDRLFLVNISLVLFNLLPAFPMDGGRVLRSLLAMTMDYGRATEIAARIGQLMAILFVFIGLQSNPFLILIALFVWIGANNEAAVVGERLALRGVRVRDAMMTDFVTLSPDDTLGHAAEILLAGSQQDFPVADRGDFTGVLTRAALLAGLASGGREARVGDHQIPDVPTVAADSPLVSAVTILRENGLPCLRVVEGGRTVGLLTAENISEYMMIRSALIQADRLSERSA